VPLWGFGAESAAAAESSSGKGLRSAAVGSRLVEVDDGEGDGGADLGASCAHSAALSTTSKHNINNPRCIVSILLRIQLLCELNSWQPVPKC